MLHDDILLNKDFARCNNPKVMETCAVLTKLLSAGKYHSFYHDNHNSSDDLVKTGNEFYNNSFIDFPFENFLLLADNSYYKDHQNITRAAFIISKTLINYTPELHEKNKNEFGVVGYPSFCFMEIPDSNNIMPREYICYGWKVFDTASPVQPVIKIWPNFLDWNYTYSKKERLLASARTGTGIIMGDVMLMNTKYSIHNCVKRDEKMNAKRVKNKKDPYLDFTVIDLVDMIANESDGTHASPIPHWRRGHVRHFGNGKKTPVSPCLVNCKNGLMPPEKKYSIEPKPKEGNALNVQTA